MECSSSVGLSIKILTTFAWFVVAALMGPVFWFGSLKAAPVAAVINTPVLLMLVGLYFAAPRAFVVTVNAVVIKLAAGEASIPYDRIKSVSRLSGSVPWRGV